MIKIFHWLNIFLEMLIFLFNYDFYDIDLKSMISEGLRLRNSTILLVLSLKDNPMIIFLLHIYAPLQFISSYYDQFGSCFFSATKYFWVWEKLDCEYVCLWSIIYLLFIFGLIKEVSIDDHSKTREFWYLLSFISRWPF